MCLGGGGGYNPPPVRKDVDPAPGPASLPDMVNNTIIPNANPRDQQEAARGEFDPPNRSQLRSQSSLMLGEATSTVQSTGGKMGAVKRNAQNAARKANRKSNRSRPKGAHGGASDIRLKENIKETGISPLGYKIYEFNYKNDNTRYRGAMAQDVITKLPEAISVKDGYFYVDYDMIDITMEVI